MRRFARLTAIAGAAAAVVGLSAGSAGASTVTAAAPGIPGGLYTSPWASGYAAVPKPAGAPAFTHIEDTYTLPALNCAKTPNGLAQFRTGLDGIKDNTIERVGVSALCGNGASAGDFAWYQMIPADPHPIVMFSPDAGDVMHASVSVGPPGAYTLSLVDLSTGQSFTVTASCPTCLNSSAQVTAGPEGPGSFGVPPGVVGEPPADFGTVHFHSIIVTDSAGVSGGLVNPNWNTDKLIQPGALNPRTVAGPLPSPYTGFADTWVP
jgi:hypothetical protein